MRLVRRTILMIALFLTCMVFGGAILEFQKYQMEYKDFEVFVTLAARAALQQQQDLYQMWDQSASLSDATNAAARHSVISDTARAKIDAAITAGTISPNSVILYANYLDNLARGEGMTEYLRNASGTVLTTPRSTDTDLFYYLRELISSAHQSNGNYNPLQFGLSYVDEEMLKILFRDNLERLIEVNYTGDRNNSNNFLRCSMELRNTDIWISDPVLIDISGASQDERAAYQQIFGKISGADINSELSFDTGDGMKHDRFSDYILQYDITFVASGWHNMRSMIGSVNDGAGQGQNQFVGQDAGAARTTVVNGERYWSIGLPSIEYSTNYSLMS